MKINLPLIFIFLLLCSVIQSLDRITLTIDKNNNPNTRKIAGPLGTFGLVTDTKNDTIFNTSDIEESTLFDGGFNLEDAFENAYAYFECRLWNPNGMNVIIICSIDNSTKPDSTYILNFEYGHLIWGDYDITIKGEKDLNITLETKSFNIPFIYSNPQTIDLNEGDQYYQLRFKTISYQREKLAIIADLKSYSLISDFDDMNTTDNELTISISRQKIEEAYTNNRTLQLAFLNGQIGMHEYEFVLDINAEYDKPPQNLVLTVNETLNDQAESHSIIAFKTNLVDIPPLTTSTFKVEIYIKDTRDYIYCFFKKYEDDNPMLLLCESIDEDFYFYMDGTEINPGEIHYKYNFTIERSPLYELIHVNGTGKRILYVSPQTFDFTVQDKYFIEYFVEEAEYFQNIKFVEDAPDLECTTEKYSKKCIIPKTHFDGKQTGYYYTYYSNPSGKSVISYDARPIKIQIEKNVLIKIKYEDNKDTILVGEELYDSLHRIYYRPTIPFVTDYDDTLTNIFNISDIEERTKVEIILDEYDMFYEYTLECRLWKPVNDKLRLFCNPDLAMQEDSKYKLQRASFYYDDYIIIIKSDDNFDMEVSFEYISFLYSDKQSIYFDEKNKTYSLKFKYDLYNKEGLYLNFEDNYIPLQNCDDIVEKRELICPLETNIIEQYFVKNGQFKLWSFNEYNGKSIMDSVLDINIEYNSSAEKETIEVEIGDPEEFESKAGENIAYRTYDQLSIPNIITDIFNMSFKDVFGNETEYPCYLKQFPGLDYLNLLCHITDEGRFKLQQQQKILNNSHYKYNFIIFHKDDDTFHDVTGKGTRILFTYPHSYNLTFSDSICIKYIMDSPDKEKYIAISQDLRPTHYELLNCENYNNVKQCYIPISFFDGKNNGLYYTYHLPYASSYNVVPYYDSNPFDFILPSENLIVMKIKEEKNSRIVYVGNNGIISFITHYNDYNKNIFNATDIEDKFSFPASIKEKQGNKYDVTCRFFSPINDNVRIFCWLNENLKQNDKYILLNNVSLFYGPYNIFILSETYIRVKQIEYNLPFIYSGNQNIYIDKINNTYELEFKFFSYNGEFLYIIKNYNIYVIDKCEIRGKKLIICKIDKEKIEEKLSTLGTYYLQYFIPNMGHYDFSSFSININYNKTITKEDIYLNITNLLSKTSDYIGLATYNTESNKNPNITTKVESGFNLNFINNDTLEPTMAYCYLKNNFFNNLLLFCDINEHGRYNLKKTTSPKTMVSLHYKYNFIINPVVNEEIVSIYDANARIISTYPTYIDLSLEESTNIIYIIKSENHIKRIRLNPDSNDLKCVETKGDYVNLLNCSIPVSHFKNKTSQYFYTYIPDGNGLWQILYSADPIYVKLPEEKTIVLRIKEEYNKHIIKVGRRESILYFVTDYDDSEYNIFDDEVEYKIRFNSVVSDDGGNRLDVSCVIWNPSNEKVRIFCLYEGEMFYDEQNIILNTTSFEYNNYTFVVYSQNSLKVKKLNCNMSFIYASPQTINLEYKEYEEMHYIKLKSVEYQNEKIYLYGENYNSEICDEIKYSDFTIECGISNKKLQKILTVNNEKFKLGIINENYGTYILDNVLDITLNITIHERYKLIIRSFKLLDNISEIDTSVAYETDVSYIDDEFVTEREGACRYRKIKDKPLLTLCTFNEEGNFSIGNITKEIYLNNIHYKYIIIIEPLENDEVVYISENGTEIQTFYPNEIDLTFEESFEINYIMNSTHLSNNIKLNPDAEDLECTNYIGLKKCIVPIEHFKGMKGGLNYVYTYHSNHMNEQSIYYNAYPLKVTLPPEDYVIIRIKAEDNQNKITMGENGTLYFVTNYDDIERNVFDIYDIEDKTSFSMTFLDELKYEHHGSCRLWKPKNDKLRVFCHLNEPFENNTQIISLYETKFNYKNYTVFILPQDTYKVEKLFYKIPFLYADKQEIVIDKNTNSYKFKFKKEVYNNELIYIYRGTNICLINIRMNILF